MSRAPAVPRSKRRNAVKTKTLSAGRKTVQVEVGLGKRPKPRNRKQQEQQHNEDLANYAAIVREFIQATFSPRGRMALADWGNEPIDHTDRRRKPIKVADLSKLAEKLLTRYEYPTAPSIARRIARDTDTFGIVKTPRLKAWTKVGDEPLAMLEMLQEEANRHMEGIPLYLASLARFIKEHKALGEELIYGAPMMSNKSSNRGRRLEAIAR